MRVYEGIWYHCEDVRVRGGEGGIGYIEIGRIMKNKLKCENET